MTTTQIYTILLTWIRNVLEPDLEQDETPTIPIIRGEQSAPKPKKEYMVIHQPMSVNEYASGNDDKIRKVIDDEGTPQEVIHGYLDYTKHYQATVSLEEIGFADNGDNLRALKNSLRLQTIKDYFRSSKVSILRTETITPIPQVDENIWELRTTMDLIILFPDEGTYEPGYIETVEFTGEYN